MSSSRISEVTRQHRGNSSQFLFLSLFMLLLAFFIAMTAGAEFDDDRTDPILDNLQKTFPVKNLRGPSQPSFVETNLTGAAPGAAIADIEAAFSSDIFPFTTERARADEVLTYTLSHRDLMSLLDIEGGNILPQSQRQRFFANIATRLYPHTQKDSPYLMGIEIGLPRHPSRLIRNDRDAFNASVLKAEQYIEGFMRNGISPAALFTSLKKGPDKVTLVFVPRGEEGQ